MQLIIFLTYRCDNNCDYCLVKHQKYRELPAKYWKEIITEIKKQYKLYICLTGGNPLLYPGIDKLTAYHIDILPKNHPRFMELVATAHSLAFSVDTLKDDYPDIDSKTKSQLSIKALESIKSSNTTKVVGIVANNLNYREIPEIVKKMTTDYNAFCNINIQHNPLPALSIDKIKILADELIKLSEQGFLLDDAEVYKEWKQPKLYKCIPGNTIAVNPDGTLRKCFLRDGTRMKNYNIEDFIKNPQEVLNAHKEDIKHCPGCKFSCVIAQDFIKQGKIKNQTWW